MRFEYHFEDADKHLMKKFKALKKKNIYGLKDAEQILHEIQQSYPQKTTLSLVCNDREEGQMLAFDLSIDPSGEPINIMDELEEQILGTEGAVSDPSKLIMDISNEYRQDEVTMDNSDSKQKKGGFLSSLFGKRKSKAPDTNDESDQMKEEYDENAFDESDDYDEDENDDYDDYSDYSNDSQDVTEEDYDDDDYEETDENESDEMLDFSDDDISDQLAEEQPETEEQPAIPQYEMPQPKPEPKKNETVQLIPMQEYVSLDDDVLGKIQHMTQRLTTESLMQLIGLTSDSNAVTSRIEKKRNEYAQVQLSDIFFEDLRNQNTSLTNSLKISAESSLRELADKAWTTPYDEQVKTEKKTDIDALKEQQNQRIQEVRDELDTVLEDKLKQFDLKQQAELDEFTSRQRVARSDFESREREKTDTLAESKIAVINDEAKEEYDKFLDNEMYNAKVEANRLLVSNKLSVKKQTLEKLDQLSAAMWKDIMARIKEIRKDIAEQTPAWSQEIKEISELESKEKASDRAERELRLKEGQLEVERTKANTNYNRLQELEQKAKVLEIQLETERQKNQLYDMQNRQMAQQQSYYPQEDYTQQQPQEQPQQTPNRPQTRRFFK